MLDAKRSGVDKLSLSMNQPESFPARDTHPVRQGSNGVKYSFGTTLVTQVVFACPHGTTNLFRAAHVRPKWNLLVCSRTRFVLKQQPTIAVVPPLGERMSFLYNHDGSAERFQSPSRIRPF
jgi:hypothetical protein